MQYTCFYRCLVLSLRPMYPTRVERFKLRTGGYDILRIITPASAQQKLTATLWAFPRVETKFRKNVLL